MSVGPAHAIFQSLPAGQGCFTGCAVYRYRTGADAEAAPDDPFDRGNSRTPQHAASRFTLPLRDAAVNLGG